MDVKTVRSVLSGKEWHPYQRKTTGKKILSGFEEFITRRAEEVGFNGKVLLRELRGMGYTGGYDVLKQFVKPLRDAFRRDAGGHVAFRDRPRPAGAGGLGLQLRLVRGEACPDPFLRSRTGILPSDVRQGIQERTCRQSSCGPRGGVCLVWWETREVPHDNPKTMVKGRDPDSEDRTQPYLPGLRRPLRIQAPVLPSLSGSHQGEDRVGHQVHQEELPGRQTIP